ncbi:Ankyrin repeat [Cinnamomum micranthum f. kanehirae]|uniref:Ankyrin repeat n=1 Tax=Cinnamomum micranthum f. kanehirae TaxID=337451 RepID=A0A443NZN3_9MAGN|nr:Ankyrin repeat [Cinnamomum micranthum f. kanehirae]
MEKQQSFCEKKAKESAGRRGDSALHQAARTGNLDQVKEVLQGCDDSGRKEVLSLQNQDGETAMYAAAENGHAPVVSELVKLSDFQTAAVKARNGYDSFHIAAKHGHVEVLKELLHSFPDLAMTTDSSNSTALHTAANKGHTEVVNLLLETDASLVKIAKSNGKTALHSAARMGHFEVVKSLLNKEPSIGLRTDKKGQTALHMAVKGQNINIVLELLNPEPSVINIEDNKGNTALHIATRKARTQIVKTLLSVQGININAINRAGQTALDIAEKTTNGNLAPILREAGAVTAREHGSPPSAAKQLKQTVSDIKHDVRSQLQQTCQTRVRVRKIAKRLRKLHIEGLNNAINSATVVAVLIATVAFAAIFQLPGGFAEDQTGFTPGQAQIANYAAFITFLIFDSIALFISLAVVVVQTSVVVIEQKAKKKLMFVINKLMWMACLFISVAFIALSYVVVGDHQWLAIYASVIGGLIMLPTIGSMCYCVILHRLHESNKRNIRRANDSLSYSYPASIVSESELINNEHNRIYAL